MSAVPRGDQAVSTEEASKVTYRYPGGDEVTFVEHED